jgi:GNAT superfamily N-acetyltransferase
MKFNIIIEKVNIYNLIKIIKISKILNICGKDMVNKYGLHHWDNSIIKTTLIVLFCSLKNELFLVSKKSTPIATYQTRVEDNSMIVEKLAVLPMYGGKGIGSKCMREIESVAVKMGLDSVTMEVYNKSNNALKYFKNLGYKKVSEKKTLKYRTIFMSKEV